MLSRGFTIFVSFVVGQIPRSSLRLGWCSRERKRVDEEPLARARGYQSQKTWCGHLEWFGQMPRSLLRGCLLRQALEIFPELGMLLDQLLLGHGQLVAQEKIFERVFVQDIVDVQRLARHAEIKPKLAGAQPVEFLRPAVKPPERFARMRQLLRPQAADGLDRVELRQLVEPVELTHGLLGERHLIHLASSARA